MIDLQLLSGMRPGEACSMRTCDVDRTTQIWTNRPPDHKNTYREQDRVVHLGPKAQALLLPFLKPHDPAAYVFSPADAERARRSALHAALRTPLS